MIEGVQIHPLRKIADERGVVMHMLRSDDPHFEQFGEIYFSSIYPNVIKAWHLHKRMTLNYAVIIGEVKLVLFDERDDSPTHGRFQEIFIGESNYCLVTIPPMIWNGFKAVGNQRAIIANCSSIPHHPGELERADPTSHEIISYNWGTRHG